MPYHKTQYISKHSVKEIFDLVVGIESYPEFLPWCDAALIESRYGNMVIAKLVIAYKGLAESYRSEVRALQEEDYSEVQVNAISGPFEYLRNKWLITNAPNGCLITFEIDFAFKSKLLHAVMSLWFDKACEKMVKAFEDRADQLYGNKPHKC
jgi:coenzyme Q-binding protein COQ10